MSRTHRAQAVMPDAGPQPVMGRSLWRLARFARPYARRFGVGIAANALARFFDLLPTVIVGRVVDLVTTAGGGALVADLVPRFWSFGLAVLGTFLGLALFQSASDYALDSMAQRVRHDLRMAIYGHLQQLEAGFFESRQTGDVMSVLTADVDSLESFYADVSTSVVRLVITFVGVFGILLWRDWRLSLLMAAPMPLALLAVRFFATRVQPQYRRARKAVGQVGAIIENNVSGMGVIQAYTAEAGQLARVAELSAEYRDAAVAAARHRAFFVPLIYAVAGLSFALLIAFGGWLTATGHGPSVGDYATFILLAMRLILPLFVFGMLINQIQRAEAAATRILELLDREPAIRDRPGAQPLAAAPALLEFDQVRFGYPGRGQVLNGVSFQVERGRFVGIVGPTGAGKSTLVKLLLRAQEPNGPAPGEIRLDGRPLAGLTLESLRHHLGYVAQDAFLFYGSVRENIALGRPEATDEEVRRAADIAGAAEFVEQLPQGYETLVGERGVKLSGGQRQRISLARAILRDPAILLLDEATASVDTRTEELIQRNLGRFRAGRMVLAVAHRLSTVRGADEILVLVDGLVVERGDHDALLAAGGVYAGLWAVQSGEGQ